MLEVKTWRLRWLLLATFSASMHMHHTAEGQSYLVGLQRSFQRLLGSNARYHGDCTSVSWAVQRGLAGAYQDLHWSVVVWFHTYTAEYKQGEQLGVWIALYETCNVAEPPDECASSGSAVIISDWAGGHGINAMAMYHPMHSANTWKTTKLADAVSALQISVNDDMSDCVDELWSHGEALNLSDVALCLHQRLEGVGSLAVISGLHGFYIPLGYVLKEYITITLGVEGDLEFRVIVQPQLDHV